MQDSHFMLRRIKKTCTAFMQFPSSFTFTLVYHIDHGQEERRRYRAVKRGGRERRNCALIHGEGRRGEDKKFMGDPLQKKSWLHFLSRTTKRNCKRGGVCIAMLGKRDVMAGYHIFRLLVEGSESIKVDDLTTFFTVSYPPPLFIKRSRAVAKM